MVKTSFFVSPSVHMSMTVNQDIYAVHLVIFLVYRRTWDISQQKMLETIQHHTEFVYGLDFSVHVPGQVTLVIPPCMMEPQISCKDHLFLCCPIKLLGLSYFCGKASFSMHYCQVVFVE